MTSERHAYVHIQLPGTLETVAAGLLRVETSDEGYVVGSFGYGRTYLGRSNAVELDPLQLPLQVGSRQFTKLRGVPGAIRDAGPDAWGRRVIEHRLQRAPDQLHEIDYLLHGPQDGAGYLSFSTSATKKIPAPKFNRTHQLPDLIAAAEAIQAGKPVPALALENLDPRTSMGGARPKATIEDGNQLWLAKFPEKDDAFNVQRVEYATLELAARCGLAVTERKIITPGPDDVLMLQRFDRQYTPGGYLRHGLVSGLTLLDAEDSYLDRAAWSYPLLADRLRQWSLDPIGDCRELYRRMVFNACVTNNDDHPRNHALIRDARGWRLSPAYDLVPKPLLSQEHRDLALTVGDFGRTASVYNLVSQSGRFGIDATQARQEFDRIVERAQGWRELFAASGVSAQDIQYIAPAMLPTSLFRTDAPEPVHILGR